MIVNLRSLIPVPHSQLDAHDIMVLPISDISQLAVIAALRIVASPVSNQSRDIGAI